jgi:RNA-binding protein
MPFSLPLSGSDRAALRRAGQQLKPWVTIGKAGLTDEVIRATDECLTSNELIKVRLLRECPIERREAAALLAERVEGECPGQIGRVFLLYRPPAEAESGVERAGG